MMRWDDVRIGDKVRGLGKLAAYGVITIVELDEESLVGEATDPRYSGGVICSCREHGEDTTAYIFLDKLELVERAPGEPLSLEQLRQAAWHYLVSRRTPEGHA